MPRVAFKSEGQLLIVGPADAALHWAEALKDQLGVTVLITGRAIGSELPARACLSGLFGQAHPPRSGWLGAFERGVGAGQSDRSRRLHALQRLHHAPARSRRSTGSYQIDLDRCRDHRQCVAACGAIGAIDFDRAAAQSARAESLRSGARPAARAGILDAPAAAGLLAARAPDPVAQAQAIIDVLGAVGEFEKPKYFTYKASICAHSRSQQPGCNQCIDVCSTGAISADGDHIAVEPHLCMGCGACTTVCPSGALELRLSAACPTWARAFGRSCCDLPPRRAAATPACCSTTGRAPKLIHRLGRRGKGLPARVIPVELHHMAAAGIDVWLGALAYGASEVAVLATGAEAPQYPQAIERQMGYADAIAQALGYQGQHLHLLRAADAAALEAAVWALQAGAGGPRAGDVPLVARQAHDRWRSRSSTCQAHAPTPQIEIALPAGAPFGTIVVNRDTCTLCLACVGACPEGAILDHPASEVPQLRFIESKCVQCGLCEATCPEDAIALTPRLSLAAEAKQPRVLNEAVDLQVHTLRQAARHRQDDRQHALANSPGTRCSRRRARSTGSRCAPIAG